MIISIPPTKQRRSAPWRDHHGFTLTEVIVASTLSTFVLAGVLSAFLLIGRTAYSSSNYSEMEAQVRRALEIFGSDARKAADLRWHSNQSVTLYVAASSGTDPVTYAYDGDVASEGHGTFYRLSGEVTSTLPRLVLVRGVADDFAFERFKLEQALVASNAATNDLETKQLQITLRAGRKGATTVAQSQGAVSARYILRNKRVSN
jgi:type II secretory pathway component PulJ